MVYDNDPHKHAALYETFFQKAVKLLFFHKNICCEAISMSTHSICFHGETIKLFVWISL